MKDIQFVRAAATSALCDDYLKKLAKEVDANVELIDWSKPKVDFSSPLIIVLDKENLTLIKKMIEGRNEKIIIALNARKDFKIITDLKMHFAKIFGFIDLSQEVEYNIPLIKNYLGLIFNSSNVSLNKLTHDLEEIFLYTKRELISVKDLHDRIVKLRVDQFKGLSLSSKFMAGEKSGGEFFEIFQNDQEILFVQVGCDSYILSSLILAEIEKVKEISKINDFDVLLDQFKNLFNFQAIEFKSSLSYCLMRINTKSLEARVDLKGLGHIYYDGELHNANQPLILKLKPGDKINLISEGAIKNLEILNAQLSMKTFFADNKEMSSKDLINEFFFEISRNKSGNFLIYDAFMGIIEIDKNVIYRV